MSDAALPNPIPPLDASPEIKAMVERLERLHTVWAHEPHVIIETANEAAALLRRLGEREDAGREWMRRCWRELNAIRARDGAPEGVSHDWWSELTDALGEMLGDDTKPWMTEAARLLVAPYEARANAAEEEVRRLGEREARMRESLDAVLFWHAQGDFSRLPMGAILSMQKAIAKAAAVSIPARAAGKEGE